MGVVIYQLSLEKILGTDKTEEFVQTALQHVDDERVRKAEAIKNMDAKAISLGAGLLLQRMVADDRENLRNRVLIGNPLLCGKTDREKTDREKTDREKTDREKTGYGNIDGCESDICEKMEVRKITVEETYNFPKPVPLRYNYGPHGKPEILDFPLQFSLSHSGAYILCAVSSQNVGADIQEKKPLDVLNFARRFFRREEYLQLERCSGEKKRLEVFYDMWTRKEAYGKLAGDGVASLLQQDGIGNPQPNLSLSPSGQKIEWIQVHPPAGYAVAVCTERSDETDSSW